MVVGMNLDFGGHLFDGLLLRRKIIRRAIKP